MKEKFIESYLETNDLKKSAKQNNLTISQAQGILNLPEVREAIDMRKATLAITNDYILSSLKQIVDISMARSPLPTIDSPESPEIYSYDPKEALKALELLGKNHKLFTDRIEALSVQTPFEEYIAKIESDSEY